MKNTPSTHKNITEIVPETKANEFCFKHLYYPKTNILRNAEGGLRMQNKFKRSLPGKPLVTIITVVRNNEDTIEKCIKSVLEQKYDNVEYIIIDGESTDSTLDILKKYSNSIDYYVSEKDSGIYEAMNKGISLASGDFIYMLNADDWLTPFGFEEIFNDVNFQNKKVIVTAVNFVDEKKGERLYISRPKKIGDSIFLTSAPCHQGTIYHKSVHNKLGGYSLNYKIVSDWDFFIKVYSSRLYEITRCYIMLSNYSLGGISAGSTNDAIKKHLKERERLISSVFPELSQKDASFLSSAYWKSLNEIINYFSNIEEKKFSEKFVQSLNAVAAEKMNIPYTNNEMIPNLFKIDSGKEGMINNLKNIIPEELPIHSDDNYISICLASDDNYEPHLWVTISSLLDKAKYGLHYYIYILDGGIINREAFVDLVKNKDFFHIKFIDMKNQFVSAFESKHIKRAAYYRLAIFYLFKNFRRIVYIDADSYILSDVSELYNLSIGDKLIAGARDSATYQKSLRNQEIKFKSYSGTWLNYYREYLKFSEEKINSYFNSGVLLLNIEKMNIHATQEKLQKLLLEDYFCHDQDILNLIFNEGQTYILKRCWNYFNISSFSKLEDYLNKTEKDNYYNMSINPKIISFILKPWTPTHINADFADLYWDKIKLSPYYKDVVFKFSCLNMAYESKLKTQHFFGDNNKYLSKIFFAIFSPRKFTKKHVNKILHGKLRQPLRKIYYNIRLKKLP